VRVEGKGDECFRDCKNDAFDCELTASLGNVLCAHSVGTELSWAVTLVGRRAGRQVDDGIDAAGRHVLSCVIQSGPDDAVRLTHSCQERLQHSSHVLQINSDRAVSAAEIRLSILTNDRYDISVSDKLQNKIHSKAMRRPHLVLANKSLDIPARPWKEDNTPLKA
jgi:hypothetical protein